MNRGNLRDAVILVSMALILIRGVGKWEILGSVALLLIGSTLHFISKGILVRNLVFCKHGIYGMVRHPFYLSNYLVDMSFCIMSGSMLLCVVYPFFFFWAYGPAMRKEERALFSRHGEDFLKAAFKIPQVFPESYSLKPWPYILEGFSSGRISKRELARLARFWAVEFFFLLLQDLKEEGFEEFISPKNYDGVLFTGAFILLSLMSFFLVRAGAGREAE